MIAAFYPQLDPLLARLQAYPNLEILAITGADLDAMRDNISQHKLRPRDALHLAAMQKVNYFALLSQDADFDHVPSVQRYVLDESRT